MRDERRDCCCAGASEEVVVGGEGGGGGGGDVAAGLVDVVCACRSISSSLWRCLDLGAWGTVNLRFGSFAVARRVCTIISATLKSSESPSS